MRLWFLHQELGACKLVDQGKDRSDENHRFLCLLSNVLCFRRWTPRQKSIHSHRGTEYRVLTSAPYLQNMKRVSVNGGMSAPGTEMLFKNQQWTSFIPKKWHCRSNVIFLLILLCQISSCHYNMQQHSCQLCNTIKSLFVKPVFSWACIKIARILKK